MAAVALKHLRLRDADGVAVVGFVNSRLMFATDLILEIGAELKSVLNDMGRGEILLDFEDVQYLSSAMLGQLVQLEREVRTAKGRLKLCGLGPVLADTFHIGRFDRIFDIHPDEASALKSFRRA